MRINIASYGGRNWLLDTARELELLGHEVRFYSYLPTRRAIRFGLKKECNYSFFILALPFLGLLKITKRSNWSLFLFHYFFDRYIALVSGSCDVFIGQSPMYVYALEKARKKFGAKIIVERGTRHVVEQVKALSSNPIFINKNPMPEMFFKRDLKGYELADFITVPSTVVKNSFIENNVSEKKIFINPFGVSLNEFKPTKLDIENSFDLIIVGQWCHRKGCDLLIAACEKKQYSLLHVGSIIDIPFPSNSEIFKHIDVVEQNELINYYSKAKIFVLPSREEGLALVQPQALACGLPIVCSKFTGATDLIPFIEDSKWIIEMEDLTVDELVNSIEKALKLADSQCGYRTYANKETLEEYLSWKAYGKRYHDFIIKSI